MNLVKNLFKLLVEDEIITDINPGIILNDEPSYFYFTTTLNKNNKYLSNVKFNIIVGGLSFSCSKLALLKCLVEAIERFSLFYFVDKQHISSFSNLKQNSLNPSLYTQDKNIINKNFQWTEGVDLIKEKEILIPTQLIYLNQYDFNQERLLSPIISTGAAASFSDKEAQLSGIYEVVERDAFMTIFLNKISAPQIQLSSIQNLLIQDITEKCFRYNLKPYLFNITNDLQIPSFLTILVDKTGFGPALTIGVKSNLEIEKAILGSMEEAFMPRQWLRYELTFNKKSDKTDYIIKKGLLWSKISMLKKLDFLLNQKKIIQVGEISKFQFKNELAEVKKIVQSKGYGVFGKKINSLLSRKSGLKIWKIIIPELQPLYIIEPYINKIRLKQVANFFGRHQTSFKNYSHPFL